MRDRRHSGMTDAERAAADVVEPQAPAQPFVPVWPWDGEPLGSIPGASGCYLQDPLKSIAAAVPPEYAEQMTKECKKRGVPTQHDTDGRPHFTSYLHQRAYLKLVGMHNKADPQA